MPEVRVRVIESREELERELAALNVDPVGGKIMAAKGLFRLVRIAGLPTVAANVLKQEILACDGDAALDMRTCTFTVDRSDLLLMATVSQYRQLIRKLKIQPFGLKRVARDLEETLDRSLRVPPSIDCAPYRLDLGTRTLVMGIVNVAPDSFSGDGVLTVDQAVARAERFCAEGADLLDIGGESTRPGSVPVDEEEELRRVIPTVREVARRVPLPISIDTYKPRVAREAIAAGAHLVNDVWGLSRDQAMAHVAAEAGVPLILMHNKKDPCYDNLLDEVCAFFHRQMGVAREAGIPEDRIILDPGIGFGKTPDHNLAILRSLRELVAIGRPILLGASRKSVIGKVLDLPVDERLEGSLAVAAWGIAAGVAIVRAHDVGATRRVADMLDAVKAGRLPDRPAAIAAGRRS